ncbi:flagellar basal body-associated FliL family protein [Sphingomonas sp. HITSZ_GF]|uniref:flagellar basal body-associated FliL family protein n=1 Tax=Sphingomonas sp. HITSZ_GF TaxID=3037247 RepID=UPI00240E8312|nr:flagellar basal body-associated FliL family protein [Sphingomonas sp. HITSZ_GF]MDG2534004.1 flagellar basal body-associated FliL family protein [Sphingomonas sp. HITSZ_GF]
MKKILFSLIVLLAGLGLGGGAALGTLMILGPRPAHAESKAAEDADAAMAFVPVDKLLAPLVTADGRLTGYVQFQFTLEVPEDKAPDVTKRLPLLLHAINMRTFKTPMAAGPDGMVPGLEQFRKVVEAAAPEAFGAGVVRKVAITQATPS